MVDSHKYLVYNNVEDRNIFLSDKDESLIHFARMIRDENEDDVQVGKGAFDDMTGGDPLASGQWAGQGGGEHGKFCRNLEDLGDDVNGDHNGQDNLGGCGHAHDNAVIR